METIRIKTGDYPVHIGPGLLARSGALITRSFSPCKAFIVSDDRVWALYGERVSQSLEDAGFTVSRFVFPNGERQKNLLTLGDALEAMARARMTRGSLAIALGGGVVGDLCGFAAAVYMRGIDFIQIPTTLLAAVDASVGGKTAVDLAAGKNLAGAFHQPKMVICDIDVLRNLPSPLLNDGAAEMIKYGVLCDPGLFESLANGSWKSGLETCVAACVRHKAALVDADERDTGMRQLLNLGHTFGHAVEMCSGFTVTHGQGVAIGMVMAFRAAGLNPEGVIAAVTACGLPSKCPYSADALLQAALVDKKRREDTITLVLPKRVGECTLKTVPIDALAAYFRRGLGEQP